MSMPPDETHKSKSLGNFLDVEKIIAERTHALVIGPYPPTRGGSGKALPARGSAARLEEAAGLAAAINLHVTNAFLVPVSRPTPATFLGSGKVAEIAEVVTAQHINLVMVDCALSPVQQRNLETAWGTKVIDRTGLILEIFGRRAHTREGALQVELAHLTYQKSRLVRSWTHLERQRGGFGFLGGPGETQIEADRRMITERMVRIGRELDGVTRTRSLHRAGRDRVPYPTVALVGYTNAGKSTLFNRLTKADVLAQDMLFATLDPTARVVVLPHGLKIILSDTVGFISDLPTMLVAAFRATLEDVIEADIVLHVRDVSHAETEAQADDVAGILADLGIEPTDTRRLMEVWNKADLLDEVAREQAATSAFRRPVEQQPAVVSALTGYGIDMLLAELERRLTAGRTIVRLLHDGADGSGLNWIYENCEVLHRQTGEDGADILIVRIPHERLRQFGERFKGRFEQLEPDENVDGGPLLLS
jgi:GTPase